VFLIILPIAKLMHDTTYLAISYRKSVHSYFGASEGSVLKHVAIKIRKTKN